MFVITAMYPRPISDLYDLLALQLNYPDLPSMAIYNHWTGLVEWTGGMEWWNGMELFSKTLL